MKSRYVFLFGFLLGVVIVSAFSAGNAYASTGCFLDTNGHWAEVFICWMKDNAITSGTGGGNYSPEENVTRAQMAVFMQKQAEVPPSTGNMYINAGLTAFQPIGTFAPRAYVLYYSDAALMRSTVGGTNMYILSASLPASLYDRQMFLSGAQVCYDATHGASLTTVDLLHYGYIGGINSIYKEVMDTTVRTDSACRIYSIVSPGSFFGSDHVDLLLTGSFPSASDSIHINSVTFILTPSATVGTLSVPSALDHSFDPSLNPDPPAIYESDH